jgi:PPP family 3-phenylpropionic acid transporter
MNRRAGLWVPKLAYFTYFAGMGSIMPFLVLYYAQIGLTGQEIGLLTGIAPLVTLVAAPLWGGLADITQRYRGMLLLAIGGYMLAIALLSHTSQLLWLAPLVVLYAFCSAPIIPLVDNAVLNMLGERRAEYGKQRLWGSAGWGASAVLMGMVVQRLGLLWGFYGALLFLALHGLIVNRLQVSQVRMGGNYWQGLRLLVTNRTWVVLLITLFINGIGASFTNNFLFLYLKTLHASEQLMGFGLGVASISELPAFFFADQLLGRWGARGLLIAALLAQVIRMFAYALMPAPEFILVINLLHGLTFSAMWVAAVAYANQHTPPGLGATVQGLLSVFSMSLGGILGAILGGALYDRIGPAAMFGWAGVATVGGVIFFVLAGRENAAGATIQFAVSDE